MEVSNNAMRFKITLIIYLKGNKNEYTKSQKLKL